MSAATMIATCDNRYNPPAGDTDIFEVNTDGPQARAGKRTRSSNPNYAVPDPDEVFQAENDNYVPGETSSSMTMPKTLTFDVNFHQFDIAAEVMATPAGVDRFEQLMGRRPAGGPHSPGGATGGPSGRPRGAKRARTGDDGRGDELASFVELFNDETLGSSPTGTTADMPTDKRELIGLIRDTPQGAPLWLVARTLSSTRVTITPYLRIMARD